MGRRGPESLAKKVLSALTQSPLGEEGYEREKVIVPMIKRYERRKHMNWIIFYDLPLDKRKTFYRNIKELRKWIPFSFLTRSVIITKSMKDAAAIYRVASKLEAECYAFPLIITETHLSNIIALVKNYGLAEKIKVWKFGK